MFACSAVTYSVNREKNCLPSSVTAPSKHVQSRWTDSSTDGRELPRKPRGVRGLDLDGGFGLIDADYRGIQRFSLFELVVELFVVLRIGFSGATRGF